MGNPRLAVVDWIRNKQLPISFDSSFDDWFNREKGTFDLQESVHWDYKDSFPSSMSDDYFGGIVRLICAFHNTFGGIIIFGVHDKTREGGNNRVTVDVERLNQCLRLNLTTAVETIHRRYEFQCAQGRAFSIDVLLVPKRPMSVPPVRSKTRFGNYPAGVIWLRKQHECIAAKSIDVPLLYSSRETYGLEVDEGEGNIDSSIPGNPATLREFVGRFDVLDQLLLWLFVEDEPRKFLWGRGGSGKSTIAYEFSRVIARSCGTIPTSINRPIDHVIFLSAKKQALDPLSGERRPLADYDFATARELFERILLLAGWMSQQDIAKKTDSEVVRELQALLDTVQLLLVIDDIDTLTTAGIDPGMDTLFRLVSRAKSGGKILYTLRNAPTHSLQSAIEVPKLTRNIELPELIAVCCRQFKVPEPNEPETEVIAQKSECRPLAVEVVVGLRRKCDSYDRSLRLFEGKEGDEARRYLFEREWNALPADNRARYLLVALSVFTRKVKFEELQAVLQFGEDQIKDCIAQTIEMFLVVHQEGEVSEYALGQATQDFLKLVGPQLEYFEKVRYAVKYYISSHLADDPKVSKIVFDLERLIRRGDLTAAVEIVSASSLPAKISQHPQFNMMAGLIFAKQSPPKYDQARAHFRRGAQGRLRNIEAMREWYWMERNSHFNMLNALEVCDLVALGKQYTPRDRSEFLAKKGHILNFRGRQSWFEDQERSLQHLNDALMCYMESLIVIGGQDEAEHDKLEAKYVMTIRDVLDRARDSLFADRPDLSDKALDILFNKVVRKRSLYDHWCEPIMDMGASITRRFVMRRGDKAAPRAIGFLQRTLSAFDGRDAVKVDDQALLVRLRDSIRSQITDLQKATARGLGVG